MATRFCGRTFASATAIFPALEHLPAMPLDPHLSDARRTGTKILSDLRIEWWGNLGHRSNMATAPAPLGFDGMNGYRLNAVAEEAMHLPGADLAPTNDEQVDKIKTRWRLQAQLIRQTETLDSILQTMGGAIGPGFPASSGSYSRL